MAVYKLFPVQKAEAEKLKTTLKELQKQEDEFHKKEEELTKKERVSWHVHSLV